MAWERGQQYRGKAVVGQFQIERIPTTGTAYVVGYIECTLGPQLGQRLRYQGYVNSERNFEATVDELRIMGGKVQRLGDWNGIGSKEVMFTAMADDVEGAGGKKTFFRATFIKPVAVLNEAKAVPASDVDDLNRKFADLLMPANGASSGPRGAVPPPRGQAPAQEGDDDRFPV